MAAKMILMAALVAVGSCSHADYTSFSYGVADPHTGDFKSQHETRLGDTVSGQYSLLDSDGTKRTVDYAADAHSGFNAIVRKDPALIAAPVAHAAPLAYAGHAAPLAYAGHAAPLAYAGHAAPLAYAGHAAPLAYAGHAAPLAYAGHAAPLAYAAHAAAPLAYAGHAASLAYGAHGALVYGHAAPLGYASHLGYSKLY